MNLKAKQGSNEGSRNRKTHEKHVNYTEIRKQIQFTEIIFVIISQQDI